MPANGLSYHAEGRQYQGRGAETGLKGQESNWTTFVRRKSGGDQFVELRVDLRVVSDAEKTTIWVQEWQDVSYRLSVDEIVCRRQRKFAGNSNSDEISRVCLADPMAPVWHFQRCQAR